MLMLSVSGCRGVVGETLTPDVASRFASSFGVTLRERSRGGRVRVVLARDGRMGGEMVHAAATAGLLACGCDVLDIGIAPTPTCAVFTDATARASDGAAVAGMVITASHNPQQWNGLKCLLAEGGLFGSAACAPPAALAQQVISRFRGEGGAHAGLGLAHWRDLGALSQSSDAPETHVQRVMTALEEARVATLPSALGHGLKVAVDCVNASAARVAPMFLRSLGCEVVEVATAHPHGANRAEAGLFPHPPEPTRENLSGAGGLCDVVRSHRCDVGFALDPDADRLALIDERGEYVGEEYTLALGALALLSLSHDQRPRLLVTNLSTSRMLDDVAQRHGARVLRTPVGEANVVETMKREGAVLGGEGNGGTIWARSCYVRDSLSGMALVLALLRDGRARGTPGGTLSGLCAGIPAYAIQKRKVDLARKEDADRACAGVARAFAQHRVDTRDGVWVGLTSGPLAERAWLHVRASNTEPILRLIAEAPTARDADALLDEASRAAGEGPVAAGRASS